MQEPNYMEPMFHYFQDDLDKNDSRRKGESLYCVDGGEMVWCNAPGEYMEAWFDTRIGPVCIHCFYKRYKDDDINRWDDLDDFMDREEGE